MGRLNYKCKDKRAVEMDNEEKMPFELMTLLATRV